MNVSEPVAGLLLAGGRSSRLGGGDKCLRLLGGRPILAHIIDRIRPQVACMVLNANGEAERFASFGLPVVADSVAGFAGPLAGIHAGLEWVRTNRPELRFAVTIATDTPFFPADLVQKLLAYAGGSSSLAVARSAEGLHPVMGLWPVALAPAIEASLKRGERKVGKWVAEHGAIEVFFAEVEVAGRRIDPFFNINRAEELAEANALLVETAR